MSEPLSTILAASATPAGTAASVSSGQIASIFGLFVAVFGPFAGQWALIVFAAAAGSLWALGKVHSETRLQAAIFLFKVVTASLIFTGFCAGFIEWKFGWPATDALAPVSFIIGFMGDKWPSIASRVVNALFEFWSAHRAKSSTNSSSPDDN